MDDAADPPQSLWPRQKNKKLAANKVGNIAIIANKPMCAKSRGVEVIGLTQAVVALRAGGAVAACQGVVICTTGGPQVKASCIFCCK